MTGRLDFQFTAKVIHTLLKLFGRDAQQGFRCFHRSVLGESYSVHRSQCWASTLSFLDFYKNLLSRISILVAGFLLVLLVIAGIHPFLPVVVYAIDQDELAHIVIGLAIAVAVIHRAA